MAAETPTPAVPPYSGAVAVINGALSLVGILVAWYVYYHYPHPNGLSYITGRFGAGVRTESAESYLLFFPLVQIWLFIVPAMTAWWPAFRRRRFVNEEKIKSIFVRAARASENVEPTLLYMLIAVFFVGMSALLLFGTISHSILLATNN